MSVHVETTLSLRFSARPRHRSGKLASSANRLKFAYALPIDCVPRSPRLETHPASLLGNRDVPVASGLIEADDVREMLAWENSGFSLDAAVRVGAHDRAGLEWLLRYCPRLLHVRFVEHCCREQRKGGCLFLADSCRSPTDGRTAG